MKDHMWTSVDGECLWQNREVQGTVRLDITQVDINPNCEFIAPTMSGLDMGSLAGLQALYTPQFGGAENVVPVPSEIIVRARPVIEC